MAARPGPQRIGAWLREALARQRILLVLTGITVGLVLARFFILAPLGYPPSSDAGGDLIWLHTYLGHPVPGLDLAQLPPPIYFFAVVAPFDLLLGPFAGPQWTMAVIPSLLTFPAYRLARSAGAGRGASIVVGGLLGSAGAFGLMVTWNSGYNAFAILVITAFYAELLRYLERPTRKGAALCGLLFAVLAGSHVLTFLFAAVSTGLALVGYVLLSPTRRSAARAALVVAGAGTLFTLPFAPVLYDSYTVSTNVGGPVSGLGWQSLLRTYATFPALAWGFQGDTPPPTEVGLAYAVLIGLGLAVLVLVWGVRRYRRLAVLTTSIAASVFLLGPLDPGNADRLGYFMPLAVMPALVAVPPLATAAAASLRRWLRADVEAPEHGPRDLRRRRSSPIPPVFAIAAAVLLVGSATALSLSEMEQSSRYYLVLNGNLVSALDWLRTETPTGARVFDGADLNAWIPGYAGRLGFSPGDLQVQITGPSYQDTFDANLIDLGSYVLADGSMYVGSDLPGTEDAPAVYLRTASSYLPLLVGSLEDTYVTLPNESGLVPLATGEFESASVGLSAQGVPVLTAYVHFAPENVTVAQTLALESGTVTESLEALGDGSPVRWTTDFLIPPSGYYYSYSVTNVTGGPALAGAFRYEGTSFGLSFGSNASVLLSTLADGWTIVDLSPYGSSLTIELVGWSEGVSAAPQAVATATLAASLGIDYFVVDSEVDYAVYVRFTTEAGLSVPGAFDVFRQGPVAIFTSRPP